MRHSLPATSSSGLPCAQSPQPSSQCWFTDSSASLLSPFPLHRFDPDHSLMKWMSTEALTLWSAGRSKCWCSEDRIMAGTVVQEEEKPVKL